MSMKNKNQGRPRSRGFTEEDLHSALQILRINACKPPPCICGGEDYIFILYNDPNLSTSRLRAVCRKCKYIRYYNPLLGKWGPGSKRRL